MSLPAASGDGPAGSLPGAGPRCLRVMLVDDEPLARVRLRALVDANPEPPARVVAECASVQEAAQRLAEVPCDLVLLDIVMPGGSGLKLADDLRRLPGAPLVVIVSAHGEHALRAFEVDVADYVTKPVRRDRLQAALLRVSQRLVHEPSALQTGPVIVVSDRGRVLRVPLSEVLYLKAELKYVSLCSQRGSWLLDEALADLEPRLGAGFLRVHRNAVVALAAARALARRDSAAADEGWQLQMANGDWLAVSRRQLAAVREALARNPR